jgi:BASS family bile acid:Na+ symporter
VSEALDMHILLCILGVYFFFFFNSLFPHICDAGMQSSLLALALANKFFEDPVVGMPPAISVNSKF